MKGRGAEAGLPMFGVMAFAGEMPAGTTFEVASADPVTPAKSRVKLKSISSSGPRQAAYHGGEEPEPAGPKFGAGGEGLAAEVGGASQAARGPWWCGSKSLAALPSMGRKREPRKAPLDIPVIDPAQKAPLEN
jgi:hypothetical protein